jgi:endonuclease/exonuclease/phosphatase family metal-dependent hydrolase
MAELFEDAWALVGKGEGFTIPADEPRKRIDYIWIRKETAIKPLRMWVPKTAASDHLPVVAELELR